MKHYTEAKFTIEFGKWIRHADNKPNKTEFYELKKVDGNTFNIKNWGDKQGHQPKALYDASCMNGVYHKISDQSAGEKPGDCFYIVNADTFLVIWFNKHQVFFKVPFKHLIQFMNSPHIKSIHYDFLVDTYKAHTLLKKEKKETIIFTI